jgi:hypothetical protein
MSLYPKPSSVPTARSGQAGGAETWPRLGRLESSSHALGRAAVVAPRSPRRRARVRTGPLPTP